MTKDDIFGVDLRMKEFFGGNIEAIGVSLTGNVFDFSLIGVVVMWVTVTVTGKSLHFTISLIGVDDVRFFVRL